MRAGDVGLTPSCGFACSSTRSIVTVEVEIRGAFEIADHISAASLCMVGAASLLAGSRGGRDLS